MADKACLDFFLAIDSQKSLAFDAARLEGLRLAYQGGRYQPWRLAHSSMSRRTRSFSMP